MTVCTARVFPWWYNKPGETVDMGVAVVAASDRMHSDEGLSIEYEAWKWKTHIVDRTHVVLIAGDLTVQSQVVTEFEALKANWTPSTTLEVATVYGALVAKVRRERAAKRILHPVGLTEETFLSAQTTLHPQYIQHLSEQLQDVRIDADAIVAGCDNRTAALFAIDNFGTVTNHTDIGFVSVGIGGIHASAQFMSEPFVHNQPYPQALLSTFIAKKRAEVAPGVGELSDVFLITAHGIDRMDDAMVADLERAYRAGKKNAARYQARMLSNVDKAVSRMSERFRDAQQPTTIGDGNS